MDDSWLTETPMVIVALFTVAKRWKQSKCPLTDDWMKKKTYIPRIEYHSALRNKEFLQ